METFPERWMAKAYSLAWLVTTCALPLAMMVGLYSAVAYTLWFNGNGDKQLSDHQKVLLLETVYPDMTFLFGGTPYSELYVEVLEGRVIFFQSEIGVWERKEGNMCHLNS